VCASPGCARSPFDGLNSLKVPDTGSNRSWIGRIRYRAGFAGYPTLRLMALAETGTRSLLGAVLGSAADRDEAYLARRLLHLLRPGMLVLLDRAFDANTFLAAVHATGAMLLARARSARNPRVLRHLPDGSDLDGLAVRIVDRREHHRLGRQPPRGPLPADHDPDRPPPLLGLNEVNVQGQFGVVALRSGTADPRLGQHQFRRGGGDLSLVIAGQACLQPGPSARRAFVPGRGVRDEGQLADQASDGLLRNQCEETPAQLLPPRGVAEGTTGDKRADPDERRGILRAPPVCGCSPRERLSRRLADRAGWGRTWA
jgi:hypothetical protein